MVTVSFKVQLGVVKDTINVCVSLVPVVLVALKVGAGQLIQLNSDK